MGTESDRTKFIELNMWIKACRHLPTYAKLGEPLRTRIIYAVGRFAACKWKKRERGISDSSVYTGRRGHGSARRIPKKEDKNPRRDQAHHAALWSRRTAGKSPAREPSEGVEQGDFIGERQRQGREGSVPVAPDGNTPSPFTQRLKR